jgi:N-methylhydantoinase B
MQMVATSPRWREEVMAKNLGGRLARHAGVNQHGRYYVSTLLGIGGSGATVSHDGVDSGGSGNITGHNVEWVEHNFPLLHLFRRHLRDGAGAGMYRGGSGAEMALVVHDAPEEHIKGVALGVAGLRNAGQGVFGGYPSAPSLLTLVQQTRVHELLAQNRCPLDLATLGGQAQLLPYCDFYLRRDDVLYLTSGGGGGYGDPLDRDPALVVRDIQQGTISPQVAREVYRVVIAADEVDGPATQAERHRIRERRRRQAVAVTRGPASDPVSPAEVDGGGTAHPIRENLEVYVASEGASIRCSRCRYRLGDAEEDWRAGAVRHVLPPPAGGPHFAVLAGSCHLEQMTCPGCGVLFNTEVTEVLPPSVR